MKWMEVAKTMLLRLIFYFLPIPKYVSYFPSLKQKKIKVNNIYENWFLPHIRHITYPALI
jgi:hypothetical protein